MDWVREFNPGLRQIAARWTSRPAARSMVLLRQPSESDRQYLARNRSLLRTDLPASRTLAWLDEGKRAHFPAVRAARGAGDSRTDGWIDRPRSRISGAGEMRQRKTDLDIGGCRRSLGREVQPPTRRPYHRQGYPEARCNCATETGQLAAQRPAYGPLLSQ